MSAPETTDIEEGKGTGGQRDFNLKETFVAPWGLANEKRPFHFLWSGDIQRINVIFTEPVEILEGYNIEGSISNYSTLDEIDGTQVQTISINSTDLVTGGYFSGNFSIPQTFEDSIVAQKISVEFELPDNSTRQWEDYTFTIRPKIKLAQDVEPHVIPEDGDPEPIDVNMQYIGFGMAQVRTRAGWEGELISKGDSIYHDMAEALVESGLYTKETEEIPDVPEEWKDEAGVEIPQQEIESFVVEFRDQIEKGELEDLFEPDTLEDLISFLDADDEERDMSPIYQQIELILLGAFLDAIDRHPSENVEMANPQTTVEIDGRMHRIRIAYQLKDTIGNSYGSVEVPVEIEDNRANDNSFIEVDVDTDWEELQIDTKELRHLKEEIQDL